MPTAGRPPLPTNELQFRGTFRNDRHGAAAAAEKATPTLTKLPGAPKTFGADARDAWRRVGRELIARKVLTKGDLMALEDYCRTVAIVAAAQRQLDAHAVSHPASPMTIAGPQGEKPHPCVAVIRQGNAEARRFYQEFGLTPSSRRRVPAVAVDTKPAPTGWDKVGATPPPQASRG